MNKFEHRLRTNLHTKSVEDIMTRTHTFFERNQDFKTSTPKNDNITTYLRKFQIDRQNLNLAKRIMDCQSEHNRNKYVKQWKKIKKFMKVRSNFKPQLAAKQPKIYKFQEIPGRGRLLINLQITQLSSFMKLLNSKSFYLLKFSLGSKSLIPNKQFLTFQSAKNYICTFFAPHFLKNLPINVKLIKIVENQMFSSGSFTINLSGQNQQKAEIIGKSGKLVGFIKWKMNVEVIQRMKQRNIENESQKLDMEDKENSNI